MAKASTEIRSLARAHTPTAINTLAGIMEQKSAPAAARVAAAQALLDRGWGKPKQPVTGGDDEDEPIHHVISWKSNKPQGDAGGQPGDDGNPATGS